MLTAVNIAVLLL